MAKPSQSGVLVSKLNEAGLKYDKDKLRFDLIPAEPLEDLAMVYTFGAGKYDDHNWRKGLAWNRVFAACMRHLWAFWRGEDLDKESGLSHLTHAAWCCFTLMEFSKHRRDLDNRYVQRCTCADERAAKEDNGGWTCLACRKKLA
jgi:hypothetical protein